MVEVIIHKTPREDRHLVITNIEIERANEEAERRFQVTLKSMRVFNG